MSSACDVVVAPGGQIWINGNRIENVLSVQVEHDGIDGMRMTLELRPTSVMSGVIPAQTIQDIAETVPGAQKDVDIARAMENAKLRSQGINPVSGQGQTKPMKTSYTLAD